MTAGELRGSARSLREVVIGRNSKVWKAAATNPAVAARYTVVISHNEVKSFGFTSRDRVWVFSYSRAATENSALLRALSSAGVAEVVYVSSATTIVTPVTRC